jgi:hypothetical protein
MLTPSQWIHQHNFLLAGATVCVGLALILLYRRSRLRWWAAWTAGVSLFVATIFMLRTPDVTLSTPDSMLNYEELDLPTVNAIEQAIPSFGKPVLVEIYADLGLS